MSVLGNAKSDSHRKTHQVESGGTGRKFWRLTRGGLPVERRVEISRGHSSDEAPVMGVERRAEGPRDRLVRRTAEAAAKSFEIEGRCNCGSYPLSGGVEGRGSAGSETGSGEEAPADGG